MIIDADGLALLFIMTLAVFGLGMCAGMWIACKDERDKLRKEKEKRERYKNEDQVKVVDVSPREDRIYML